MDTKDPNIIAETELLQAAVSIEAAAKKLAELKPREKAVSASSGVTRTHTHTHTHIHTHTHTHITVVVYSYMYISCINQYPLSSSPIKHQVFTVAYHTPQHADESLNFEEQILEAAKNIASATSALVRSATAAQRELVAQGKLSSNPTSEDSQWSEGLVSAVSEVLFGSHVVGRVALPMIFLNVAGSMPLVHPRLYTVL